MEPWTSAWPAGVAWTRDIAKAPEATHINMASSSSIDHGGFSRRPNPENQKFNLRRPILFQSQCSQASRQCVGGRAYMSSRLLHTTLLALLGNDMLPCLPQPSPAPVTTFASLILPLPTSHTPFYSIFHIAYCIFFS